MNMTQRTTINPTLPQIKPAELRTFHAALAQWYADHGRRDLPWRTVTDAYPIWISEVMLQQTQVATVLARFYHPFLEKFPTIESLAAARQESVLKAWEGLGYYTRARNLHKAAIAMVNAAKTNRRNRATLPDTVDGLLALSGIGRNTAHAILAFGYHRPVAILEANVKRVVARIFALETPTDIDLWQGAETLLNHATPFDYNQAMMDIGATICTPRSPACALCPANSICRGQTEPERYPTRKQKKPVPTRDVTITVLEDAKGRLHLATREEKLLGGLWGFPQSALDIAAKGTPLGNVTHVYSHFKLIGDVRHIRNATPAPGQQWFTREQIAALPLSKVDHKVLALVDRHSLNQTPAQHAQIHHTEQKNSAKSAARKRKH